VNIDPNVPAPSYQPNTKEKITMIVPIAAAIVGISIVVTTVAAYSACVMASRTAAEYEEELGEVPLGRIDPAYNDLGVGDVTYSDLDRLSRLRMPAQPVVAYSSGATLTPTPKR